jgi:hypothetical protein
LVLLYLLQQYGFNLLLVYKNDLIQEKKKRTHISPLQTPFQMHRTWKANPHNENENSGYAELGT